MQLDRQADKRKPDRQGETAIMALRDRNRACRGVSLLGSAVPADIDNVVGKCERCNCGKGGCMPEEAGPIDPRSHPRARTSWDGLERMLVDF